MSDSTKNLTERMSIGLGTPLVVVMNLLQVDVGPVNVVELNSAKVP